jgi:hypothetical protein
MFPYSADDTPIAGTFVHSKPKGYSRVLMALSCAPESALETGEVIEMQVWVGASEVDGSAGPSDWYVGCFKVDPTWTADWKEVQLGFEGFEKSKDLVLNVIVARINGTTLGTNADENFYLRRLSIYPEP